MPRLLGLGFLFAASAAAAEPPVASSFALPHRFAEPRQAPEVRVKFESPRIDYSEPARPERRRGFVAAIQVAPNSFLGLGLSDRKARRSSFAPDPAREVRRGGRKLALRFTMDF